MTPIRRVLIANRGEIACRIMRAAKARGCASVAVYSDADRDSLHVRSADIALHIGASEPAQSYLNIEAIIDAARKAGADAVHPGYGFLSERADFAAACERAGLIFIGPSAESIAAMGDKAQSKRRMIAAGVPTIPGYNGDDQSDETLAAQARDIGFPVMVKASAGGGGRGQRLVATEDGFAAALASARREALGAFGDSRMILEKAVIGARHVEVQVLGDAHGALVHLGERDCSLQRRRQKVIEEAPSPALNEQQRRAIGEAAVAAARAVSYRNAGTVEFLYDPGVGAFYFLEMNTRIQVEHPVTECVAGLDLVSLQFDIAEGAPLPFRQDDIRLGGAAIEARVYAEDPAAGFAPLTGKIAGLVMPKGVRVDAGVAAGDNVSAYYDPMIAKIIAHAPTRDEARLKLIGALRESCLFGLATNRDFLCALLEDEAFARGAADVGTIDARLDRLARRADHRAPHALALCAALLAECEDGLLAGFASRAPFEAPLRLEIPGGETIAIAAAYRGRSTRVGAAQIDDFDAGSGIAHYTFEGARRSVRWSRRGEEVEFDLDGEMRRYRDVSRAPARDLAAGGDEVRAPMNGLVTHVAVKPGDRVARGDVLAVIEAMKMEHALKAPRDGVVADVRARQGAQAAARSVLVALQPD